MKPPALSGYPPLPSNGKILDMSSVPSLNLFSQQVDTNRPFQFEKRSELVIGTHNKTLSIIAMCVSNSDNHPPEG
jgi:hypothetical protein